MRKRYFIVLIAVIVFIVAFYYFSLPTSPPNILNEPQNQGNESQGSSGSFKLPSTNQNNAQQNETGGGGTGGGEGGSGGAGGAGTGGRLTTSNTPKVYYTLNIASGFGSTDIITFYYENDTLVNTTRKTPYSIDIEANTGVCVAAASAYTGYFWTIDQNNCDMINCGAYPSGCNITMDGPHNITIHQNS